MACCDMPREDRRIIFDLGELYKAIYALCTQKSRKKPPVGAITSIRKDKEDDNKVFIGIENPLTQASSEVEYSRDFIAAALLLFCRGCGIPLPKTARKSVELGTDSVTLRVQR